MLGQKSDKMAFKVRSTRLEVRGRAHRGLFIHEKSRTNIVRLKYFVPRTSYFVLSGDGADVPRSYEGTLLL